MDNLGDDAGETVILTFQNAKFCGFWQKGGELIRLPLCWKSNKTISAQKNSAMRRLSLRSNAEMYARINSAQGMKELNLYSAYGDNTEWKKSHNTMCRYRRKMRNDWNGASLHFK